MEKLNFIKYEYTSNELTHYSKILKEFKEIVSYLNSKKTNSENIILNEDFEFICNHFLDVLNLINPIYNLNNDNYINNQDFIINKFNYLLDRHIETYFLIYNVPLIIENFNNSSHITSIKINEFIDKSLNLFIDEISVKYNIDKEVLTDMLFTLVSNKNQKDYVALFEFCDLFLENLRNNSFKNHNRLENNNSNENEFPFKVSSSNSNSINFKNKNLERYLLFEKVMNIHDYDELSINKKAKILSLILNISENTLKGYINNYNNKNYKQTIAFKKANIFAEKIINSK